MRRQVGWVACLLGLGALPLACAWVAGVSGDAELATLGADSGIEATADDAEADADADKRDAARIGSDARLPEAGLPPDPGNVTCGARKCPIATQVCCAQGGAPFCESAINGICNGAIARCDEAADCPAGQVCCVTAIIPAGVQASCQTACGPADRTSCRTNAECAQSACVPWRCAEGTVETCGGEGSDAGCVP